MPMPVGWVDDGVTLRAPNGFAVTGEMRRWTLAHECSLGVPLTQAYAAGNEQHQIFWYGVLGWNARDGAFLGDVGQNLVERTWPTIPPAALRPEDAPMPIDPNTAKLARVQQALGTDALGVYFGIWTVQLRAAQFAPYAAAARQMGFEYALVKCGEWGTLWYDGTATEIAAVLRDHGLRMVPYWYCRPQVWHQDLAQCARLAQEFGIIDLDIEEVFVQVRQGHIVGDYGAALHGLVAGIRQAAPASIIIADGYGDPQTTFGGAFPYWAIAAADCYQPQWYASYWGATVWPEWLARLRWADAQCGEVFAQAHLGWSFPIRPNVTAADAQGNPVAPAVAEQIGRWCASFQTGLTVWEFGACRAATVQAFKTGLRAGALLHEGEAK
jgi:hypothetical protein